MIDAGLPGEWSVAVREACSRFKQGHLVTRPPFFYGATAGYGIWDLTRDAGDAAQDHEVLQLDDDLAPNYGLITTQTCDIYEERKPRKPWVQVAPVYDGQELIPASSIPIATRTPRCSR